MIRWLKRLFVLLAAGALTSMPAGALEIALVLSQHGGAHALFAEAVRAKLAVTGHRLVDAGNIEEGVDGARLAAAGLILASGHAAAEAMARRGDTPTLAVLLSHSQYARLRQRYPDARLSAIVLDQPPERQLALIRAVVPGSRRLGMLFGPETGSQEAGLRAAASLAGLEPIGRQLSTAGELMPALQQTLEACDALLVLADPLLNSPAAARAVLLSSYRYRRPVFGYSRAYVEAGALAAVFSGPAEVAHDVADWLSDDAMQRPQVRASRYFDIAINAQVARALNLNVADTRTVRERMRKESRP
jgi:hypothetical protein